MNLPRSVLRPGLLAVCLLVFAPMPGLAASHEESFRNGIIALEQGDWDEAVRQLQTAIDLEPRGSLEEIRIYGAKYQAYLPHYYLGLAHYNGGDAEAALAEWEISIQQSVILNDEPRYQDLRRIRSQAAQGLPADSPYRPIEPIPSQVRQYEKGQYTGPATCASSNCHGNAEPSNVYDVLQNEFNTWTYQDPHFGAFNVLYNEESQLIARNMPSGLPAHEDPACLTCHVTQVPRNLQALPLEPEDGISCESCHGPAGGWLERHNEGDWSHADSVENGLIDLRNIRLRATLCMSCHVGDRRRQVDHELIAAGHPELIFELDNYSAAMPPHWKPFRELRDREGRRNTHGVNAWAVGQVVAFREGLLQLGRRSATEKWPEFAEMSCDACHHSLATSEWRQVRGYRYRAGLPPWSPARWAVLRHLVAGFAPEHREALDGLVERVGRGVAEMTERETVAEAAGAAAALLDEVIPRIERASWNRDTVQQLVAAIASDGDYLRTTDRESAEQAVMALESMVSYLSTSGPVDEQATAAVDRLFAELEDPYDYDWDRIVASLNQLARR